MNKSKKKLIIYPILLVGFTAGLVGCKKGGASSSISSSETTDSSSSSISSSIGSSTSSSNISSDSSSTSEESSSSVQLVEVVAFALVGCFACAGSPEGVIDVDELVANLWRRDDVERLHLVKLLDGEIDLTHVMVNLMLLILCVDCATCG